MQVIKMQRPRMQQMTLGVFARQIQVLRMDQLVIKIVTPLFLNAMHKHSPHLTPVLVCAAMKVNRTQAEPAASFSDRKKATATLRILCLPRKRKITWWAYWFENWWLGILMNQYHESWYWMPSILFIPLSLFNYNKEGMRIFSLVTACPLDVATYQALLMKTHQTQAISRRDYTRRLANNAIYWYPYHLLAGLHLKHQNK